MLLRTEVVKSKEATTLVSPFAAPISATSIFAASALVPPVTAAAIITAPSQSRLDFIEHDDPYRRIDAVHPHRQIGIRVYPCVMRIEVVLTQVCTTAPDVAGDDHRLNRLRFVGRRQHASLANQPGRGLLIGHQSPTWT